MPPHLRLERKHPSGWTLAHGATAVGCIDAGRLVLHGYPDAPSATEAATVASRVMHQWHEHRRSEALDATVYLLDDEFGFACTVPENTWPARLLELAQRLHVATLALRYPEPEPAA